MTTRAAWLLVLCAVARGAAADCAAGEESLRRHDALLCLERAADAPEQALVRDWVTRSANIVAGYYGRFPARQVTISVRGTDDSGVDGGRTTSDPLHIAVRVGRASTAALLADDWVLVHEMVHLALPELGRPHNWLAEGLAVYVEGIARAQAGNRAAADVWAEDRESMPRGLPRSGEGGMDETPNWGRTYWGGAIFCLQADIGIRRATDNRHGLQTALRAVLERTGGYAAEASIEAVLKAGDEATGTRVLETLYARVGKAAPQIDLQAIWRELGVPADPRHEPFDEHAPLAAIRAAITARP